MSNESSVKNPTPSGGYAHTLFIQQTWWTTMRNRPVNFARMSMSDDGYALKNKLYFFLLGKNTPWTKKFPRK